MDPNGNPIHDEEGNPINHGPPVNQELLNDPNDTPMWNDTYFHGLIDENPFKLIQHFNDLCDIYKTKNVTDDAFKLRAFPFTLQGDAKAWMRSLPSDSIRTFQELTNEFINHFFPPSKVERLRMEINGFTQWGDESLYDAWVRFKKLLRAYPPHGYSQPQNNKGYNQPPQQNIQQSQPSKSLEEIMQNYIKKVVSTEAFLMKENELLNQQIRNQQASFQNLESVIGRLSNQVAERPQGTLPSNTQINPNNNYTKNQNQQNQNNTRAIPIENVNQIEFVNAISTRSGLTYEEPQIQTSPTQTPSPITPTTQTVKNELSINGDSQEAKVEKDAPRRVKGKKNEEAPLGKYMEPIQYPKALRKEKVETQRRDFIEMMKQVHVNMPLIQVLKGMPNYGKFIKNLLSLKDKYEEVSAKFLVEECSAIFQKQKMPPKLGDQGCFVIPCNMGGSEMYDALVDLGASVNLMPYSIYKKLNLGELKLTRMVLKTGNQMFDTPIGIAEDLMVKVGKLTFPVDFVILEMLEDEHVPTILG
ncbi:uncharacterized protein [Rutidosis leptorrhynchoides]|uniref:uncharacterized protein n=1 Tax=Rutidosis leptorrhynchoides TaxID=125765 RepID=UPI003A99163E